jgi:hypothetical protein
VSFFVLLASSAYEFSFLKTRFLIFLADARLLLLGEELIPIIVRCLQVQNKLCNSVQPAALFSNKWTILSQYLLAYKGIYEGVSKSFRTESITKYTRTCVIARWEATQRVMVAELTRLTHKIAIKLHLKSESCTICSSRSRRPVRKILDTPSYLCNLVNLKALPGSRLNFDGLHNFMTICFEIEMKWISKRL